MVMRVPVAKVDVTTLDLVVLAMSHTMARLDTVQEVKLTVPNVLIMAPGRAVDVHAVCAIATQIVSDMKKKVDKRGLILSNP